MAPDDVRSAWERVLETWPDAARHDELFKLVVQHQCFAWAAARYRERGNDPIAEAQLARLRRAATATMMASASTRPGKEATPYRSTMFVLVALVVALLFGMLLAKCLHDNAPARPTKPARR